MNREHVVATVSNLPFDAYLNSVVSVHPNLPIEGISNLKILDHFSLGAICDYFITDGKITGLSEDGRGLNIEGATYIAESFISRMGIVHKVGVKDRAPDVKRRMKENGLFVNIKFTAAGYFY